MGKKQESVQHILAICHKEEWVVLRTDKLRMRAPKVISNLQTDLTKINLTIPVLYLLGAYVCNLFF